MTQVLFGIMHNKAWEQVTGAYSPLIILDDNEEFENPFDQVIDPQAN